MIVPAVSVDVLNQAFEITRSTALKADEQRSKLAAIIKDGDHDLSTLVKTVNESDRTGHREVIGKITKITGYSLLDFGFAGRELEQLKGFGSVFTDKVSINLWHQALHSKPQLSEL